MFDSTLEASKVLSGTAHEKYLYVSLFHGFRQRQPLRSLFVLSPQVLYFFNLFLIAILKQSLPHVFIFFCTEHGLGHFVQLPSGLLQFFYCPIKVLHGFVRLNLLFCSRPLWWFSCSQLSTGRCSLAVHFLMHLPQSRPRLGGQRHLTWLVGSRTSQSRLVPHVTS